MGYEAYCRELFAGAEIDVEDLFLLEPHQIRTLKERGPRPALAAVLVVHPAVHRCLVKKCPEMAGFFAEVAASHDPAVGGAEAAALCDSLVWEIGELIIYCKDPALYDERTDRRWSADVLLEIADVEGKVVLDVGAGTGRVTFLVADRARHVFAVEPAASLRHHIATKAVARGLRNVFPVDGVLDRIPLPDGFAEVLFTSNAIGWNLAGELREIERVVRPGGRAVHLMASPDGLEEAERPLREVLMAPEWGYTRILTEDEPMPRVVYTKRMGA